MGLDQYGYAVYKQRKEKVLGVVVHEEADKKVQIQYWRKHPNLHGWMCALYLKRGGKKEFNCQELELKASDLKRLEKEVKSRNLPQTAGFFFGTDEPGDYVKEDLRFIKEGLKHISKGARVYYNSWW